MIEQVIISSLLNNDRYARKVLPHMKSEYFSGQGHKEIYQLLSAYYTKYNSCPTIEAMVIELDNKKLGEGLYGLAVDCLEAVDKTEQDFDWLVDQTEKFAQERAVYNAIMKSINIIDGKDDKFNKNAIPTILSAALAIAFNTKLGHDYFEDAEAQWEYYRNPDNKIPFKIQVLNRVTNGGVTRKTLSIVMAGINVGKTTFLINMAESYLEAGLNVYYCTLEVAEEVIRERTDACMLDMGFEQVRSLDKANYLGRIQSLKNKTNGRLIIKEFSSSIHVGHIRHDLQELKLKKDFVPDVIIVDYLTLMSSAILSASSKGDTNGYFTSVTEELRFLMKEFNAIGWSAAQFNRAGQDKEDITLSDTGLSIGIQATSDFTLALMSPEEISVNKMALAKVLKNRFANKQTIGKFMIGLDNDIQKFYDIDLQDQTAIMSKSEKAMADLEAKGPAKESGLGLLKFS